MQLYLNKTSPYARLVMVVIHEKHLAERVQLVLTDPWASPAELLAVNPAAKVPALVTDDGQAIIDSNCICGYLDDIGEGSALLPTAMPQRLPALMKYGLGRGLIDVAFGFTIEKRYGTPGVLAERWLAATSRIIATLEKDPALLQTKAQPDLGDLALAVGLAYVGFRLSDLNWRKGAPQTAGWFDRINDRRSMQLTEPE